MVHFFLFFLSVSFFSAASKEEKIKENLQLRSQKQPNINKKEESHMVNIKQLPIDHEIKAWTVNNDQCDIISIAIGFKNAGTKGNKKPGLMQLLSNMLKEGCGPWNSQQFKEYLLENNIELEVTCDEDHFMILLRFEKKQQSYAFNLLKHLLKDPIFDPKDLKRIVAQSKGALEQALHNEMSIAKDAMMEFVASDHVYCETSKVILKNIDTIEKNDLDEHLKKYLCRDNMRISVVGNFDPSTISNDLAQFVRTLPDKSQIPDVKKLTLKNMGKKHHIKIDIPQSIIYYAQEALDYKHEDFYALHLLNSILSGLSLNSKLWNEVRELRGLAYYVQSMIKIQIEGSMWLINTATNTQKVDEVITIINEQLKKVKDGELTQEELDFHCSNIIGSYPLSFDSTKKMAFMLLHYQLYDRPIDYTNTRNKHFSKVTLKDLKRVAKECMKDPAIIIVGR